MGNNGSLGFLSELGARLGKIESKQFIAPIRSHEAHFVVIDDEPVGHKLKRLCTLQRMLEMECEKLVAEGNKETFEMKADFCDIVGRIIQNEVWRQYPILLRKHFVICNDWTICWEKAQSENKNFVFNRPAGPREPAHSLIN